MGVPERRKTLVAAIALIVVHAILLVISARTNSVTFDEAAHLPAGCAYLKYGEFGVYNYNPPLLRMLAAWPVMFTDAAIPNPQPLRKQSPQARIWLYARAFERAN